MKQEALVAVLEERKRLAYMRYQGGVDTQLNALDADRDLLQAKLDLRQIKLNELLSVVQLYKALGGGWQSFDPYEYLNCVPAERVAQIHIAGHSKFQKYILDTHDHPVIDPVWRMYDHAIRRIGPTATLLEWDDKIPTFDEVHAEARKAEKYLQAAVLMAL
jgi:uncharacterized protein (UPF0276 family)